MNIKSLKILTFWLIILYHAFGFCQLGHHISDFEINLSQVLKKSVESNDYFKQIEYSSEDFYITVKTVNDTIEYFEYFSYVKLTNVKVMSIRDGYNLQKWLPCYGSLIEFSDLYHLPKDYISDFKCRKYVREDSLAFSYLMQCTNPHYDPQSQVLKYTKNYLISLEKYLIANPNNASYFDLLSVGYQLNSMPLLTLFFEKWRNQSIPQTNYNKELQPIVKASYEIYESIYNPFDISRIAKRERHNDLIEKVERRNTEIKYAIIKNSLQVAILETFDSEHGFFYLDEPLLQLTINDFRPTINIDSLKILCLTDEYEEYLLKFLDNEQFDIWGNIVSSEETFIESIKRKEFLNHLANINQESYGWEFATLPIVTSINFNIQLNSAEVFFLIHDSAWKVVLNKNESKWIISSSDYLYHFD
jgi:hypothetical protein